jgi:hypothetical protein
VRTGNLFLAETSTQRFHPFDATFRPRYAHRSRFFEGAVMARENLLSLIGDLKARMTTIRDSL